jgi:transcriptional regulator with XRE-family HTH domain
MTIAERFGANLTRHRRAADLTQEELSVMAALHRTEISQLERGLRIPRLDTASSWQPAWKSESRSWPRAWAGAPARCEVGSSAPRMRADPGEDPRLHSLLVLNFVL